MLANWNEMTKCSGSITLSERQSEIARLASLGFINNKITDRQHVSFHTVKSTISMIMNKTGSKNRSEFSFLIF